MAVYQAPDIKDRIAVGDDLYQIADSGGKKKLTPDPTEITEPGTPINKALLQPMADAIQKLAEKAIPYNSYWWRRRPTANSYAETQQSALGEGYSHTDSGTNTTYYYLDVMRSVRYSGEEESTVYRATLKYASSISINQSTGAISLVNPSTYAFDGSESVYDSSVYGKFQGRYVQGFLGEISKIYYIPGSASMRTHSWGSSGGDSWYEQGYEFTSETSSDYMPKLVSSVKQTAVGTWEVISSDSPDTYPRSGTSGGYDWVYLGRISDAVLTPSEASRIKMKSVSVTSANFSDNIAEIPIDSNIFFADISVAYGNFVGVIDKANIAAYGVYEGSNDTSPKFNQGSKSLFKGATGDDSIYVTVIETGIKFRVTKGAGGSAQIKYIPLDSLEVGI